ncbi:MAG: TIGR00159 family protein [Holophagales bacterium]|nr:TIGR00159 family protein [Holophagales bacterium]MYH25536.1 TIGR00159 family protein [Holophagales bacterium]
MAQPLGLLGWRDLVDLLVVGLVVYNLLLLIRGTGGVRILVGILVLAGAAWIAALLRLDTLQASLNYLLPALPVVIVVLFQNQIRRALARVGRNPLLRLTTDQTDESGIGEIVIAAQALSLRKLGALIVIERVDGLRDYAENGIVLDAEISYDLLLTVFARGTPLHDGAVIVQKDRVAAAACFLPLTTSVGVSIEQSVRSRPETKPAEKFELGTRHRAAIGITEETDAVVVVVSEESGRISIAHEGRLTGDLTLRELRNQLFELLLAPGTSRPSG